MIDRAVGTGGCASLPERRAEGSDPSAQARPWPLTERPGCRYGDLQYDPKGATVIALEESSEDNGIVHRLVAFTLSDGARRILVEVPANFQEMQRSDPQLAAAWRRQTREIFRTYLAKGYRVVDLFLSDASGRGHYLLVVPT